MPNILEVHDVVKQYASHRALDGVSLNVPKGSIFGLLGPNGAGKTSLIRIITQITAPDEGYVYSTASAYALSISNTLVICPKNGDCTKK